MPSPHRSYLTFINILGTLGYISLLLLWTWLFIVTGKPLLEMDTSWFSGSQNVSVPDQTSRDFGKFSPLVTGVVAVITALILIVTAITLVRLPKNIGKTSSSVAKKTANAIIPAVTGRRKLPEKERRKLSYKITLYLKIMATFLPIVILLSIGPIDELGRDIILTVGTFLTIWPALYFSLQHILVVASKENVKNVW